MIQATMATKLQTALLGILLFTQGAASTAQDDAGEPANPAAENEASPGTAIPGAVAGGMNNARLREVIARVDPQLTGADGAWRFSVNGVSVMVVTDEHADRMRIIIPIRKLEEISSAEMTRLMQANFDSALDARYAVARGTLWATYIHPLSALSDREFLLGLGQTVNIVRTYGHSYSSGLLIFGGGDSPELQERELIDELMRRGLFI